MHKRSPNKLEQRKIQSIVINGCYYDKQHGETISKLTRLEIMDQLNEPTDIHLIPDLEKGEVLIDSRGRGTLQKLGLVCSNQAS
jgi:hypothetical protein